MNRVAIVLLAFPIGAFLSVGLAGCDTPPTQGPRGTPQPRTDQAAVAGEPVAQHPVAAWRDRTVTREELQPALVELAGATALRDALLDHRVGQALAERSMAVDAAMVERESTLLAQSLDRNPDTAARLLEEIRVRQGLGPVRFEALLRRNAGLRALVQPEVRITQDALERQQEAMFGPKRVCRVISVGTLAEADGVKRELEAGADFKDLAARRSNDASASRGGLLAPIARTDPSWPEQFRQMLFRLAVGEASIPTLVDSQYLIVLLVEERPGDGSTLESHRGEVESALRLAQERVLMEERARSFVAEMHPTIYDSGFDQAWRRTSR